MQNYEVDFKLVALQRLRVVLEVSTRYKRAPVGVTRNCPERILVGTGGVFLSGLRKFGST